MFATIWAYQVPEHNRPEFVAIYGPDGVWARLFARHDGFVATRLYGDMSDPGRFLTVDLWHTAADFAAFKRENRALYDRLDRDFAPLSDQCHLGTHEGEGPVPGLFRP